MHILLALIIPAGILIAGFVIEWQAYRHKKNVERKAFEKYKQTRIKQ